MVAGKVPAARSGMAAIVILEPRTPREFPPQTEKPFMDQISQTFFPAGLFVRTGQPTEFRNSDDVLHNDVGCDIHPGMSAQIVATSTPYAVMADTDGNFVFDDVEPDGYTMIVYVGADKIQRTVEVSGARTVVNVTADSAGTKLRLKPPSDGLEPARRTFVTRS
jgi:hypothetical protein